MTSDSAQKQPTKSVRARRFLVRLPAAILLFCTVVVLLQDVMIFPAAVISRFRPAPAPPANVMTFEAVTTDGRRIQLWRNPVTRPDLPLNGRVLFLHGNGGTLAMFYPFQRLLAEHNIVSYSFDYRGYGGSTGWPSEKGIYRDGEAAMALLLREEKVLPSEVAIMGVSLGTGPAAYLAAKFGAQALILVSPYTNLRERASEDPYLGFLSPFLWYEFPTIDFVSSLRKTSLLVVHGEADRIISIAHAERITEAYRGEGRSRLLRLPGVGHNDLIFRAKDALGTAVDAILQTPQVDGSH